MKDLKQEIDYFKLLNISEKASRNEIKKAYKKLAREYHPDKFQTQEEKIEAEKQFKVIKKAYDAIIENLNRSENAYSTQYQNDVNNIVSNPDFIQFFVNKTTINEFQNKDYGSDIEQEAIDFIQRQIKNLKLSRISIYEAIRKQKLFIVWDVDESQKKSIMLKEIIFREHIKQSDDYKVYLKHRKLFLSPNIHLEIKIKPSMVNKLFDQKIIYYVPKICNHCNGNGCNKCSDGILMERQSKQLKFSQVENDNFYVVEGLGFKNKVVSGNMHIRFKVSNHIDGEYEVIQKQKNYYLLNVIDDTKEIALDYFWMLKNLCKKHKLHVVYSSIIIFLIIIIILVAALLA